MVEDVSTEVRGDRDVVGFYTEWDQRESHDKYRKQHCRSTKLLKVSPNSRGIKSSFDSVWMNVGGFVLLAA